MSKIKGFLKSMYKVVAGFTDAIVGIVNGNLKVGEALHFAEGSRTYKKKQKEEFEKQQKKQITEDLKEINNILKSIDENGMIL